MIQQRIEETLRLTRAGAGGHQSGRSLVIARQALPRRFLMDVAGVFGLEAFEECFPLPPTRNGRPSCTYGPFIQRLSSRVKRSITPANSGSDGSKPTVRNCLSPVWTSRASRDGSIWERVNYEGRRMKKWTFCARFCIFQHIARG